MRWIAATDKFKEIKMSVRKGSWTLWWNPVIPLFWKRDCLKKNGLFEEIFSIRPQIRERRIFL